MSASGREFDARVVERVDQAVARRDPAAVEADLQALLGAADGAHDRVLEGLAYLRHDYEVGDG